MKTLIKTLALISIVGISSACNKVGFNQGPDDSNVNSQGIPPNICTPSSTPTGPTYSWYTTSWSACSVTCGTGIQTRTASCQSNNSCDVVSSTSCSGQIQPATTQSCQEVACNTGPNGGTPETQNVTVPQPMVDFVLIIDTSMTNAAAVSSLASNMTSLLSYIQTKSINWQACVITTDVTTGAAAAGADGTMLSYAGQPLEWAGSYSGGYYYPTANANPYVLNASTAYLSTVLSTTADYIQSISPGQGNAQGIGALYWMANSYATSGCFRSGATVAAIVMTDKDENSTYGNCNRSPDGLQERGLTADPNENFCQPTAPYEDPQTAVDYVNTTLNTNLVYSSIIVEPGDTTCLNSETVPEPSFNTQNQTFWSPAFYGNEYVKMSTLTNGTTASICQPSNYVQVLSNIGTKIVQALQDVTLNCTPMAGTSTSFTGLPAGTTTSISGNVVTFSPALPPGTNLTVNYTCN